MPTIETLSQTPLAHQVVGRLAMTTTPFRFHDLSRDISDWLRQVDARDGLLTAHIRHTSASLTIQENADDDVQRDLLTALDGLAPQNAGYRHDTEGPDDMPAHIRAMLTSTSVAIPVVGGRMDLGTWQALYLIEHRAKPHDRTVTLVFQGAVT